ncbi:hypothetical protein DXT94_28355 [Rhizobium sp. ICMP 5592]|nr:hypothetical protein [Rhizobium sp. ICMP 5592]
MITTRSDIDIVRNIHTIPVVNLEVFFYSEPSPGGMLATSKRFDGAAFIQRIRVLADPAAAARREARQVAPAPVEADSPSHTSRIWKAIRQRLRSTRMMSAEE